MVSDTKIEKKGWFLGFGGGTEKTVGAIKKIEYPVYVIFLTDGDCSDKSDTYEVVRELSNGGAFIQFIGIGDASFSTLQKLDDLSGRKLDNADFFAVDDIDSISDDELYARLMTEFPEWIPEARSAGFIN